MILTEYTEEIDLTEQVRSKIKTSEIEIVILMTIGSSWLLWFKTQDLGLASIIISIFTGIIVALVSIYILTNEK